jgi:hypothetical protein
MEFHEKFSQYEKLIQVVCFANMFGLLNELNISVQYHISSTIYLYDKIECFQLNASLRVSKLNGSKIHVFPIIDARLEANKTDIGLDKKFLSEMKEHLLNF